MLIPEPLAEWVRERIARLAIESKDAAMVRLSEKLQGLPLLGDMGGIYALRPSGDVVSIDWDAEQEPVVERDARVIDTALVRGSLRYPELAVLLPVRTPESVSCHHCGGTGIPQQFANNPILRDKVSCWCGGLGFVPPSWLEGKSPKQA